MAYSSISSLKERCIEEQDILVYFWANNFEEIMFDNKIDSEFSEHNIEYFNFDEFLAKNPDVISNMSMNNLVYLLKSNNEIVSRIARCQIMEKFRNGEHVFSGENATSSFLGIETDSWGVVYSKLGKENIEEVKKDILARMDELEEKDYRAYSIISKSTDLSYIDNFLSVYEQGVFTPEKMDLLEKLASQNPNILNKINFRIFEDSIFDMGEEFISRIAKYPNFSNKFIKLSKNNPELFEVIKNGFKELEDTKRIPEALDVEQKIINYVTTKCHKLKDVNFDDLCNCAIRNKESSHILKIDYSENYEEEFEKACDEKFNSPRTDIDDKRTILLSKYYGMTTTTAKKFYKSYVKNAEQLSLQDEELKKYLSEIEKILNLTDIEEINKLYYSITTKVTPLERLHYEDILREEYSKTYVKSLKDTDSQLKENQDAQYIEFEGKRIKQIKLNGDFSLLIHSTDSGFKGKKELKNGSFLESWQQIDDPERHLASCCFMNQDFLGHVPANENGVLAVFANVKSDELNLVGPTDIDSHIKSYNYISGKSMHMTADNLPYYTRRVYNEVPIERKNPDYFLIFDDSPEKVVQNAYKAASEFDVPVIFVDKREIEKQQLENLDSLIQEFSDNKDLSVLARLVSTYETNVAGWLLNRDPSVQDDTYTQSINNERFRADFEQRENAMYMVINNYMNEIMGQDNYVENMQQLLTIMQSEIDKYHIIEIGNTPISKTKMKFNAQEIIDRIISKVPEIAPRDDNNTLLQYVSLEDVAKGTVMRGEVSAKDVKAMEKCLSEAEKEELNGEK